jgi:hypothetical protein
MLVLQLFFVIILKMLQYFLKCWTNFYSFFVNIFVKCCINFGTTFLPTFFEKKSSEAATALTHGGAVAPGQRPASSSRAPAMPSPNASVAVRAPPEP